LQRLLHIVLPEGLQHQIDAAGYVQQTSAIEEALFRVCQEAASNAVRHACCSQLSVAVVVYGPEVILRVADDGVGLGSGFRPGVGLSSMPSRIEAAARQFRITPTPPHGTLNEARLPRSDRTD
jgi:signal transduction histidine kinase